MDKQQGELPLKRRRMKLEEAEDRRFGQPHHGHMGEEMEEELRVRLPKMAADAVAADPEGAAQRLELEAQRMLAELMTPWSGERPPMAGYWEVTDHKTGTLSERWWWSGAHWELPEAEGESPRNFIGHESFMAAYAWRGLQEMPKEGYPIPPYNAMMFSWRFPDIAAKCALAPIGSEIGLPIPFYGAARRRRKLEA